MTELPQIVLDHLRELVDDFDARVAAGVVHVYGSPICASAETIEAMRGVLARAATQKEESR